MIPTHFTSISIDGNAEVEGNRKNSKNLIGNMEYSPKYLYDNISFLIAYLNTLEL